HPASPPPHSLRLPLRHTCALPPLTQPTPSRQVRPSPEVTKALEDLTEQKSGRQLCRIFGAGIPVLR
ncbi:hypothetical protein FKM82_021926, partial [Ascaphus truei]